MHFSFPRFFLFTILFGVFLYPVVSIYNVYAPPLYQSSYWQLLLFYFIVITLLGYYLLLRAIDKHPKEFVLYYLGILTVKFLSALTIIIFYVIKFNKLNYGFSINFLILFFLFTIFEMIFLLRLFKK